MHHNRYLASIFSDKGHPQRRASLPISASFIGWSIFNLYRDSAQQTMAKSESRLPFKSRSSQVSPSTQGVIDMGDVNPKASLLPNLILSTSAPYVSSITDDSSTLSELDSKGKATERAIGSRRGV